MKYLAIDIERTAYDLPTETRNSTKCFIPVSFERGSNISRRPRGTIATLRSGHPRAEPWLCKQTWHARLTIPGWVVRRARSLLERPLYRHYCLITNE